MDIAALVSQIDAEITNLQTMRAIVEKLASPVEKDRRASRTANTKPVTAPAVAQPTHTILPPKVRRDRVVRRRRTAEATKALAAPASNRPVFVPKANVSTPPAPAPTAIADEGSPAMEATMRKNFLADWSAGGNVSA